MNTEPRKLVTRTSQGLVSALFDTIDKLNAKEVTPEEARAVSHTARTIVGVAQLELNHRKMSKGHKLRTLEIAGPAGDRDPAD